ncbi:TonB-dependent receptor [Sphingomonas sp. R-74633]|uniref:TonB-dependent receptor n=1 Tax=Sphingomonas sp. R-74633 TaxID=2751188 RepID=UPI0015D4695C|nr:TonB-dependent receptor [Sphingomonas sp. R-74633]
MITRGKYLFVGVSALGLAMPAAAMAQAAPTEVQAGQDGAQTVPAPAGEGEIVVTAIRRSMATSQAIKQDSDQIVDSVVAEDIGKLPDVTGAESLARITGVQVDRGGGEASGVRVRGLPDLTTTYNGREIFTAEGRSVALQDFPSASIARIDVYKSASANLVEPGIAGLIDVRSRMPLDFKGSRIAGGVSGVHWSQSQKIGLDANLLLSTRWHTGIGEMGFLIEGSYADVNFLDSARVVSQSILTRTGVAGTTGAIRYPNNINITYSPGDRYRPSAHTAFQWRPSSNLEIYADGLYQGFRSDDAGRNLTVNNGAGATLSNITYFPGTNMVRSFTATLGTFPTGTQNAIIGKTDTYQAGAGFVWRPGKLRVTGDAAYTDSTYSQFNQALVFTLTRVQPTRNYNFDSPDGVGGGTVTLSNYDLYDRANYRMTAFNESGRRANGKDIQARLDFEYPVERLGLTKIQGGIRFTTHDAKLQTYSRNGTAPAGQFFSVLPLDFTSNFAGRKGDDVDSILSWVSPTPETIRSNADYLRTLVGVAKGRPAFLAPTFQGNEKGYSAYLQARYALDLGVPVDGLIGIRAVRTDDEINGFTTVPGTVTGTSVDVPVSRKNSYTDYLPNVSLRAKLTREIQMRLAFTQTRTRPAFASLSPSITVGLPSDICATNPSDPDCLRVASGGNPDLKPTKSTNYDASLEYYFTKDGSITVGAFYRDLTGFINTTTTTIIDPVYNRLKITRPENGGKGRIGGFEAGFRTFLRAPWLPNWMHDFGVLANYTYLDHKSELPQTLAATLPGLQPISGVSSHLINGSIFYENRSISLRAAYNYRSSFQTYNQVIDPTTNILGPTLPVVEKGRGTLDLSATLNPVENISVNFSVANVLGSAATNSRAFDTQGDVYPYQVRFLETVYRLGVRFRL